MERCFRLSFLARCLLPSVARLFKHWHRPSLSSTSKSCKHQRQIGDIITRNPSNSGCNVYRYKQHLNLKRVHLLLQADKVPLIRRYRIDISSQFHQQGDGFSHRNPIVDVAALQTCLQFGEVTTGRATDDVLLWQCNSSE